jgi:hypothetical protein
MILNLQNPNDVRYPYLTFQSLVNLSNLDNIDKSEINLRIGCKVSFACNFRIKVKESPNKYKSLVKIHIDDGDSKFLLKYMQDPELIFSNPGFRYPKELETAITEISLTNSISDYDALIKLFNSVNINLYYINSYRDDIDKLVKYNNSRCTKRMSKYFKSSLTEISRSEYCRRRSESISSVIRSGNKYYKRKIIDE